METLFDSSKPNKKENSKEKESGGNSANNFKENSNTKKENTKIESPKDPVKKIQSDDNKSSNNAKPADNKSIITKIPEKYQVTNPNEGAVLEKYYDGLCKKIEEFVNDICPKGSRDASHGIEHFEAVVKNTKEILQGELIADTRIISLAIICAWLHDVADHKYDKDGKLMKIIKGFLNINVNSEKDIELIEKCIECVSYSKQVSQEKEGKLEKWFDDMGEDLKLVRDIVSDADKLEAIDKIGMKRCVEYISHTYNEKNKKDIPLKELQTKLNDHAHEKLLRLKDHYIYTKTGKKMAEPKHSSFVKAMENFMAITEKEWNMLGNAVKNHNLSDEKKREIEMKLINQMRLPNYSIIKDYEKITKDCFIGMFFAYLMIKLNNSNNMLQDHTREHDKKGAYSGINNFYKKNIYGKNLSKDELSNISCITYTMCEFLDKMIDLLTNEHILKMLSFDDKNKGLKYAKKVADELYAKVGEKMSFGTNHDEHKCGVYENSKYYFSAFSSN